MAQINAADWDIDPTVVDGTELAARLNRLVKSLQSGNSGATRPAGIAAGGMWVKTGVGTELQLMWYDGMGDHKVGSITAPGGKATIGAEDNSVAMAILFGA
jgi:hypothetical protein